jgi:hypothetical protein
MAYTPTRSWVAAPNNGGALDEEVVNIYAGINDLDTNKIASGDTVTNLTVTNLTSSNALVSQPTLIVRDEKTAGTDGGTFTSGAWRTRDINTAVTNTISGASLGSNQITLPAGTYLIDADIPACYVDSHKGKLRNVTDNSDVIIGTSSKSPSGGGSLLDFDISISRVVGIFTIAATKVFELQNYCQTTRSTNGFGVNSNFGVVEVYTQAMIIKIA